MPRPKWRDRVVELLNTRGPESYSRTSLRALLRSHRAHLEIPPTLTDSRIVSALIEVGLNEVEIKPLTTPREPGGTYRAYARALWKDPSPETIALSLRTDSYLSHGTAARIHGLIRDTAGNPIFANCEQTAKPVYGTMTQAGIDRAFTSKPRKSNLIYEYEGSSMVLVSGKHTGKRGVVDIAVNDRAHPITNLERTLVDITVRPAYAGGVDNVLRSFSHARHRVDVLKLYAMLNELAYAYPYHQAIGFYLTRARYEEADIRTFRQQEPAYDFYLENAIKHRAYDANWRMYYPHDLEKP